MVYKGFGKNFLRGGKPKCKESDIVFLEECLKKEPRTYNSVQLAQKLESVGVGVARRRHRSRTASADIPGAGNWVVLQKLVKDQSSV